MNQSDDLSNGLEMPSWELTCYLLIAWFCVFLVIIKGVKSSGKASYFLAIFPYVVLITLLIRAITLEGSWNGIKYFITPDFKKLLEPQVKIMKFLSISSIMFCTIFLLRYAQPTIN